MILSNEPGYYREGAFGIRIENLQVVQPADPLPGGDPGERLCFETLSFVPIDQRLMDTDMLSQPERDWINTYHTACRDKIAPLLVGQRRRMACKMPQAVCDAWLYQSLDSPRPHAQRRHDMSQIKIRKPMGTGSYVQAARVLGESQICAGTKRSRDMTT